MANIVPPRVARIVKAHQQPFPFNRLSTELALEIIACAATPDFSSAARYPPKPYLDALSICRVSRAVRSAALPRMIRTVVFSENKKVYAFIRAINMQREYAKEGSSFAVDYSMWVRKMWCGTCWEALVDEPRDGPAD